MNLTMKLLIAYKSLVILKFQITHDKNMQACVFCSDETEKYLDLIAMSMDTKSMTHMVTAVYQYYMT